MIGHVNVVVLAAGLDGGFRHVHHFLVAPGGKQRAAKQVISSLAIALALDGFLHHAHGFVVQFGGVEHPGLAHLHFGQVPAQGHGLAGSFARALHPHLIAAVVAVKHRAGVGAGGIGQREAGIHGHRVFEHLQREFQVLPRLPPRVALAAQVKVVGLQVLRRLHRQRFQLLRRKRHAQGLGDLARHFVLHFENVLHLAVEALRPQRKIRARIHQLRIDAQAARRRGAIVPVSTYAAPSCWPICAGVTGLSRNASTVGREKVFSPRILESSVITSSVMPSRRYSSSLAPLRFSK